MKSNETPLELVLCRGDLGRGRSFVFEVLTESRLSLKGAEGISVIDLLISGVAQQLSVRISVSRKPDGVEISLARGDGEGNWWPEGAAPRMILNINQALGIAKVSAAVGSGLTTHELLVDEMIIAGI